MDLLNKFGNKNKAAEGSANVEPVSTVNSTVSATLDRGKNLIDSAKSSGSASSADESTSVSAANSESVVESKGSSSDSNTSEGWTTESALKEIKKLREENKQYRVKYTEQIDKIKQEQDLRLEAQKEEMKELLDAKRELDRVKAEQEDKKRDISEKLVHREAKISELQTLLDMQKKESDRRQQELYSRLEEFEIQRQAEVKVYQERLNEELEKVPEKYRDYANLIVKGAGDARDALLAINEAKVRGMFEEKTVVVNHSVPGASDGARSSNERVIEAQKAAKDKMTSQQKIKSALDSMFKDGQSNTAFRIK